LRGALGWSILVLAALSPCWFGRRRSRSPWGSRFTRPRQALRSANPVALFPSAASVAFLTGVIGGACMGVYPVVGMAVAIAFGLLPVRLDV
jgi:hypothetical protein